MKAVPMIARTGFEPTNRLQNLAPAPKKPGKPRKPTAKPPCAADVELTVQRWERLRADAKSLYEQADQLEQQLIATVGVGGSIVLSDNRKITVSDNFLDKTGQPKLKAWKVCGVSRYDVSVK